MEQRASAQGQFLVFVHYYNTQRPNHVLDVHTPAGEVIEG
ncbi:hypothetical protein SAMN05421809_3061 [Natronorubrum daqingense]|uniref:Uncharacterized protein n=1 Tax=Natronorubrum daqingense TaxID=588898 RepID=A0A1N7F752_9EURY|nr:hypothetical protein SAMN05421809_3061 [Natronorubrum daqingense]